MVSSVVSNDDGGFVQDPLLVVGVGVDDRGSEDLDGVVGVSFVGSFDDSWDVLRLGVDEQLGLGVVLDVAFPPVDGTDGGNDVAACRKSFVDECAGVLAQPFGIGSGDRHADNGHCFGSSRRGRTESRSGKVG